MNKKQTAVEWLVQENIIKKVWWYEKQLYLCTMKEIIAKLKQLSNLDYCQSAEDMQYRLEEINDILNTEYPEIEESEE